MKRVSYELSVKFYHADHEKFKSSEVREGLKEFSWGHKRCFEFNYSGLYLISLCETKSQAKDLIKNFKKDFGLDWSNERFTITSRTFELF